MDVNEEAISDWVADTDPIERVWTVVKRESERQSIDDISSRAYASPETARVKSSQPYNSI